MNKKIVFWITAIIIIAGSVYLFFVKRNSVNNNLTTVKFGMLPYGDHSQAIIAAKNGWFKEVGIDFQYELIKVEAVLPDLNNNRLDVSSCAPGIILSSYDNASNICMFSFADVFQGYAILAQPGGNYKNYQELLKSGLSDKDAIKVAVSQLKGKTFAYPSETAIKPFIDILLEKAGMTRSDFKSLVQDDAININAMRNHQADFQVGGVPSRITLQKEGYKEIVSSMDIVKAAMPSPDSKELSSVFNDGWAITKTYYDSHRETVLRLASVNFRINDFILQHPSQALAIHMPYLSQITGEKYTTEDGTVIYDHLDPFYNFAAQRSWFFNDKDPLYYKNLYGSIINSFKNQHIYKSKIPAVDDVIFADDVYKSLDSLKNTTEKKFLAIDKKPFLKESSENKAKLAEAHHQYSIYNYLDADKITADILK
ncbi:hypothetical protein BEL04_08670 [Mucilaginibacter sp. PPCGB 2223]|uniref:ABC transporter substrate-binding protein n=1 Tax=Mucilaginibacter sp. PPCGB 2223 TaxID=1886027 RepID=UPI000827002B|nr:ABC transporter substrate-binding protein [Mucilaginibacter sp. PPCGB 2223]OCX54322.1 hypothetical protein BEL04_08670 [Mucilaginibacter sp. PPCGB 2223]